MLNFKGMVNCGTDGGKCRQDKNYHSLYTLHIIIIIIIIIMPQINNNDIYVYIAHI
jgi:hypothetical protein